MLGLLIDIRNFIFALLLGIIGITFTPPESPAPDREQDTSQPSETDDLSTPDR